MTRSLALGIQVERDPEIAALVIDPRRVVLAVGAARAAAAGATKPTERPHDAQECRVSDRRATELGPSSTRRIPRRFGPTGSTLLLHAPAWHTRLDGSRSVCAA